MRLVRRAPARHQLPDTLSPLLSRLYSARGLVRPEQLSQTLNALLAPDSLLGLPEAAEILAAAIQAERRIVIAGDYDADGATGVAVAMLGLKALGARWVDYVVPDRFTMGYGLSVLLVDEAAARGAEVLVTVDSGISSLDGVASARGRGMTVVITDHHLAGAALPDADAIVNPNQPGCRFPDKSLAGVGVMFYLLCAVRARLREAGAFAGRPEPVLASLLDLVALGTVADMARFSDNNRILVAQGLARIRSGRARPGIASLLALAGRDASRADASDLGFVLGPRINAAGRLDDIRVGIECLLGEADEATTARASTLDSLNRARRQMTRRMTLEAEVVADERAHGVVVFDPSWHEGIVGLIASRLKERLHRPVIAFAAAQEVGVLKGSARSISGFQVRDALALVDARHPGLILRFGGHAMAAGLSLKAEQLASFRSAFDQVCAERLSAADLEQRIETDGALAGAEFSLDSVRSIQAGGPWGQGFPEPSFDDEFALVESRPVGADQQHIKYRLRGPDGATVSAIDFDGAERQVASGRIHAVYTPTIHHYQGRESLDLRLLHLWPA